MSSLPSNLLPTLSNDPTRLPSVRAHTNPTFHPDLPERGVKSSEEPKPVSISQKDPPRFEVRQEERIYEMPSRDYRA